MRVGDCDRGNTAECLNSGDGVVIEEANAIPQNITGAGLNQKSTLTDGELWFRLDAPNFRALLIERIVICGSQILQSRPLLPLQSDELALVFAYRAAFRRPHVSGKLGPTSHTNIARQRLAPAERCRQ